MSLVLLSRFRIRQNTFHSPKPTGGNMNRLTSVSRRRMITRTVGVTLGASLWASVLLATAAPNPSYAEQPPPPCHPNPSAAQDEATVRSRGDVVQLPQPLKDRLAQLAN